MENIHCRTSTEMKLPELGHLDNGAAGTFQLPSLTSSNLEQCSNYGYPKDQEAIEPGVPLGQIQSSMESALPGHASWEPLQSSLMDIVPRVGAGEQDFGSINAVEIQAADIYSAEAVANPGLYQIMGVSAGAPDDVLGELASSHHHINDEISGMEIDHPSMFTYYSTRRGQPSVPPSSLQTAYPSDYRFDDVACQQMKKEPPYLDGKIWTRDANQYFPCGIDSEEAYCGGYDSRMFTQYDGEEGQHRQDEWDDDETIHTQPAETFMEEYDMVEVEKEWDGSIDENPLCTIPGMDHGGGGELPSQQADTASESLSGSRRKQKSKEHNRQQEPKSQRWRRMARMKSTLARMSDDLDDMAKRIDTMASLCLLHRAKRRRPHRSRRRRALMVFSPNHM
ncbi:hypothetical protein BX600DRAFT_539018 [Xylariales sp. PMI_506]|nr:hypothetical protein BX600DRAFT_539018 [Xylariales sp. PMI_506]